MVPSILLDILLEPQLYESMENSFDIKMNILAWVVKTGSLGIGSSSYHFGIWLTPLQQNCRNFKAIGSFFIINLAVSRHCEIFTTIRLIRIWNNLQV